MERKGGAALGILEGPRERPSSPHLTELDGHTPDLSDVLCVDRESPAFSRLPPR